MHGLRQVYAARATRQDELAWVVLGPFRAYSSFWGNGRRLGELEILRANAEHEAREPDRGDGM